MVAESTASLNTALTCVVMLTPVAPADGTAEATVGGVVSPGGLEVVNTTSTQ